MNIDYYNRSEQRKFGLTMALAITAIGLIRWWLRGEPSYVFFGVAAAFLALGLAAPFALRPLFRGWVAFALALNWIMTRVLLTLVYYPLIVPMGLAMQLLGKDPLKRGRLPDHESYWEEPDGQPDDIESYYNQF